jgi:oligopeptidase A
MEGVPDSAKSLWANAHAMYVKSKAAEGAEVPPPMDAAKGPWRITLDMPSYIAVLSHMQDRAIREEVYKAYLTRASEKSTDETKNNIPLIYEILQLNHEMAQASTTVLFVVCGVGGCWIRSLIVHSLHSTIHSFAF